MAHLPRIPRTDLMPFPKGSDGHWHIRTTWRDDYPYVLEWRIGDSPYHVVGTMPLRDLKPRHIRRAGKRVVKTLNQRDAQTAKVAAFNETGELS